MPLGWWTDLEVARRSGSAVVRKDRHTVVRTPDNPDYYWGNFVLVDGDSTPDDAQAVFDAEFPTAGHVAIGLLSAPDVGAWHGVTIETNEVRAQRQVPLGSPVPGYQIRALTGPDWAAAWHLETQELGAEHADFAWRRIQARERLAASGDGVFVGCFDGDDLVANLGIVVCGEVARYQSVSTREEYRRQGLATWLLAAAGQWAKQRGAQRWVIISEPGSDASRLYDRLGFGVVESAYQVERAPA